MSTRHNDAFDEKRDATTPLFKAGEEVLLLNLCDRERKGGKMTDKYTGPYMIEKIEKVEM